VINPKRTVPRSILISISAVVIIYILIQSVSQGVLGKDIVNFQAAPLAETAKVVFGPVGYIILIVGASISMFGFLSGELLNVPRALYALAKDNVIPLKALAKIHKKFATPYIAIIVYAAIGFIIAATGSFEKLVVIATSAVLILYFGVAMSVIKLRSKQKTEPEEFKIPGGWTVPILAMLTIIYFLSNLSKNEMIGTVIFIGILSLIFGIMRFLKKKKL
ncbi:MAG: APC family permease, partial [Aquaticitalea sp.]